MVWSKRYNAELAAALGAPIAAARSVGGGDICDAARVELDDGRSVFVKSRDDAPPELFAAEADGLGWLSEGPLRVPAVIAHGRHWLALEWLDLTGAIDPEAFGRGLAALHQLGAPSFGYSRNNYLATLPQDNAALADWPTFYVERRLRPVCARARLGLDRDLDRLRDRVDRFGPAEPAARLHGDLWWGNVGGLRGGPVIFDPAVYGGHREIDLAMLALFGAVPDRLIAAYAEVWPLADGWRDRVLLYQLYPLAVHAALFGGSYGARVRSGLVELG